MATFIAIKNRGRGGGALGGVTRYVSQEEKTLWEGQRLVTGWKIRYNKFRKLKSRKKRHGLQPSGRMKSRHTILKGASKPCLRRLYS